MEVSQRQAARQLQVTGKSWKDYGRRIEDTLLSESHLSGFTRVDLLQAFTSLERVTGNVRNSLKLTALAADVARGRHISLAAASNALAKAEAGSFSALRRLNIVVPQGATKMQALAFVTKEYAGQALSGTSAQDRFNATWVNTQEIIGTALLPTVNRMLTSLGDWLNKQEQTGKLQRNVNQILHDGSVVAHALGDAIHFVDSVTGSFANTLKILIEFQFARIVLNKWVPALEALAAKWGLVAGAAEGAAAAESGALGAGGLKGAAGGVAAVGAVGGGRSILPRGGAGLVFSTKANELTKASLATESKIPIATKAMTAAGVAFEAFAPLAATIIALQVIQSNTYKKLQAEIRSQADKGGSFFGSIVHDLTDNIFQVAGDTKDSFNNMIHTWEGFLGLLNEQQVSVARQIAQERQALGLTRLDRLFPTTAGGGGAGGPFGNARPMTQYFKHFALTFHQLQVQAQDALTQSTADDVRSARQIVAEIRAKLNRGQFHGQALLDALGLEQTALSTIWAAEAATAQKRAARAQAAKQKILAALQNSIDPLKLEIELSRAQAFGLPTLPVLKKLLAAALAALRKGLTGALEKQALDQITSLKQQIKAAETSPDVSFQVPAKLSLDLARDQALGRDTTKDLLKIRKAILKFISTHRKNIAALTDAYNQLASINQQLGSSASSALGLFKQASTKALTEGLGLSDDQRRRLRQRLAGLGPGGTVSGSGVGAAGFAIDPTTGRPIGAGRSGGRSGGAGGGSIAARTLAAIEKLDKRPIHVTVEMDGAVVTDKITKRQQRKGSRNSSQRRGPNAGYSY